MKTVAGNRIRLLFLTSLLMLLLPAFSSSSVHSQPSVVTIVSYHVDGAPNYNAPGNESFWKSIAWNNVPLAASVSPGGGKTPDVLVKSANDGFNVYVLFRWNDSQGPSYGSATEEYKNATTGMYQFLDFSKTAGVNQLAYNDSYYYPDRVALLWFLNGPRGVVPAMRLDSTGAITNGTANIWHWQSVPTDSASFSTSFAGNYTTPAGKTIFPPNNSSFAEDDYTNNTGFYPIAGSISGSPNLDPYADPFIVVAGNYFSAANKTWTVEMVRPFVESQAGQFRVQLSVGSTYFVGFAVWNGKLGESAHIKSVSQWYSLSLSNQTPPVPPTPEAGISLTLAGATGAGLLLAGLIIGIVLKPERKKPGT